MRIAVYYPWVYLRGGGERLLLELLRRSRHHWTLYTNRYDPESTFEGFREHDIVELPRVSVKRSVRHVAQAGITLLTQRLAFDGHDALMICTESLGSLIALRARRLPIFCLCLTPLRVAFDPHTRKQFLNSNPSLLTRLGIAVYTRVDRLGWRRYEKIFCISQEVAARVRNARLAPDDRVEIIYPGVDMEEFRPSFPIEPYFLLPGRIMWAKNIELGIDAFRALKTNVQAAERFRLVVAGIVDEKSRTYLNALKERAAGIPDVEFVIDPSGELYARLHQHAYAVLFTSLNEDWGLVPLEGMAAGRPVIAVAQGGPLESVLHGETGFLCPPEPKAFAYAMQDLIDDPARAETIGSAGRERAALFSWSNFVSRIDDYAESLIQGSIEPISQDTSTEQVGG